MFRKFFTRPASAVSSPNFYISDKAARNTVMWWATEGAQEMRLIKDADRAAYALRNR